MRWRPALITAPGRLGLFDLSGRVVLATGGASRIGLGFLTGCARQGADVVIWDKNLERQAGAMDPSEGRAGRVRAQTIDVADEAAVIEAFSATLAEIGRVDCVLANADFASRAPSSPT